MAHGLACSPPPPVDASLDADAAVLQEAGCEQFVENSRDAMGPDASVCPIAHCEYNRNLMLSIGTGRDGTLDQFRSIEQNGELYLVPGEQGLQHVLVAFRGRGFSNGTEPVLPLVDVRVMKGCNEVGFVRFRLPWRPDPMDPSQLAIEAIRVVVSDDLNRYEYCSIIGETVTLVIDATLPAGNIAHRELQVRIPDIDPAARADIRDAWKRPCMADAGQ